MAGKKRKKGRWLTLKRCVIGVGAVMAIVPDVEKLLEQMNRLIMLLRTGQV